MEEEPVEEEPVEEEPVEEEPVEEEPVVESVAWINCRHLIQASREEEEGGDDVSCFRPRWRRLRLCMC